MMMQGGGAQKLKGFDMMGWVEGGKEVEGGAGTSLPKSQEAYIIAALNANETFQSAEMKNYLLELYKSMYSEIIEMAKEKKLHMDGRLLGEEKEEVFEGVAQCRMEFGQEIPEPKKSDTWSFKYFPTQEKDPKEKIPPLKVQLSFECCPILPQDMEEHMKKPPTPMVKKCGNPQIIGEWKTIGLPTIFGVSYGKTEKEIENYNKMFSKLLKMNEMEKFRHELEEAGVAFVN